MSSREEYTRRLQEKLVEWNAEIDTLIIKAGEVMADIRDEFNEQLEALKTLLAFIRQKFEDLQQVSEIAWEILKSGIDLAWTSMEEAIEAARSRVRHM